MHRGYIKFWRAVWDNKYWPTDRPYTKAEAWLDMLLMASYKDTSFEKRGVWVSLKRGQLGRSVKGLANKWHWSQGKVIRFLNALKVDEQIEYQKNNITTTITIINYDHYQGDGEQNGDQTETKQRPDGDQTETYNKDKKVNKVKKDKKLTTYSAERILIIEDFNTLFNAEYMPNSEALVKLMDARLKEGHTVEHFKAVHRNMKQAWENDTKMSKFLRPQTLYTGKFSSYLNWRTSDNKLSSAGQQTAEACKRVFGEEDNVES